MLPEEFVNARTLPNSLVIGLEAPVESVREKNSSIPPSIRFATGVVPESSCPEFQPSYNRLLPAALRILRPVSLPTQFL